MDVEAYVEGKEKRMQWCWQSVELTAVSRVSVLAVH